MFPNIIDGLNGHHDYVGDFHDDLARFLFYMSVRYDGLLLSDALDPDNRVTIGKLSALLRWNAKGPVDELETQRNYRIYGC